MPRRLLRRAAGWHRSALDRILFEPPVGGIPFAAAPGFTQLLHAVDAAVGGVQVGLDELALLRVEQAHELRAGRLQPSPRVGHYRHRGLRPACDLLGGVGLAGQPRLERFHDDRDDLADVLADERVGLAFQQIVQHALLPFVQQVAVRQPPGEHVELLLDLPRRQRIRLANQVQRKLVRLAGPPVARVDARKVEDHRVRDLRAVLVPQEPQELLCRLLQRRGLTRRFGRLAQRQRPAQHQDREDEPLHSSLHADNLPAIR